MKLEFENKHSEGRETEKPRREWNHAPEGGGREASELI